jgi:hypothetical protein
VLVLAATATKVADGGGGDAFLDTLLFTMRSTVPLGLGFGQCSTIQNRMNTTYTYCVKRNNNNNNNNNNNKVMNFLSNRVREEHATQYYTWQMDASVCMCVQLLHIKRWNFL